AGAGGGDQAARLPHQEVQAIIAVEVPRRRLQDAVEGDAGGEGVRGVPLLVAAWVMFKRLRAGHSPCVGDSEHLHQRLFKLGLTQRQVAWILYLVTAGFGYVGLFLQGKEKVWALAVLLLVLLLLGWIAFRWQQKKV
ncbi:MAG: hypothetical protein AAB558_03090, partial [Patescibacteria group bacterium]